MLGRAAAAEDDDPHGVAVGGRGRGRGGRGLQAADDDRHARALAAFLVRRRALVEHHAVLGLVGDRLLAHAHLEARVLERRRRLLLGRVDDVGHGDRSPSRPTRSTASSRATCSPAAGVCSSTVPGSSSDASSVTLPTRSPAPSSALRALSSVSPTTSGTSTCSGPRETRRVTVLPRSTVLPCGGVVSITGPFAHVGRRTTCSTSGSKPALAQLVLGLLAREACDVGTVASPGPVETSIVDGRALRRLGVGLRILGRHAVALDVGVGDRSGPPRSRGSAGSATRSPTRGRSRSAPSAARGAASCRGRRRSQQRRARSAATATSGCVGSSSSTRPPRHRRRRPRFGSGARPRARR